MIYYVRGFSAARWAYIRWEYYDQNERDLKAQEMTTNPDWSDITVGADCSGSGEKG